METLIDIFGDNRKIPVLKINSKIKIHGLTKDEEVIWNKAFGYIQKKPHGKLEYLAVNCFRNEKIKSLKFTDIERFLSEEDVTELKSIEDIFNNKLSLDLKAFILAVLKIPTNIL